MTENNPTADLIRDRLHAAGKRSAKRIEDGRKPQQTTALSAALMRAVEEAK